MLTDQNLKAVLVASALVIGGTMLPGASANAQIIDIAGPIQDRCLTDRGDGKIAAAMAADNRCTAKRVRNLARAYEALSDAVRSGDPDRVIQAATALRGRIRSSSMYRRCWGALVRLCGTVGRAANDAFKQVLRSQGIPDNF